MNAKEAYRLRVQAETRKTAVHNGEDWDQRSLQFLEANLHMTDRELAPLLGRTQGAVSQRRYMIELRKQKREEPTKLAPTVFQAHAERCILHITFYHNEATLTVFYPAGTPDLVLERAFTTEGYDLAVFRQWQQEKVNV